MSEVRNWRWGEFIGVLGVIASLVFVGLEVRESSRATRAATDAEIASQFVALNNAMFSSPELMEAFDAASEAGHPSAGTFSTQMMILAFFRSLFHVWSNTHRQHLNGSVNPLLFDAVVQELSAYSAREDPEATERINQSRRNFAWAWESERFIYNPRFQAFVDSIVASLR